MKNLTKYEDFGGTLDLPKVVEIEPFGSCNLRCTMCHVSYAPPGPKPQINFEAVEKLKSLAGKYVVFGSNFEPTAHPRFADMISMFVDYGFKMDIVTNGTLLTDPIIETMTKGDFNKITFSFDGIKKETYEKIRRNANFEDALEKITKLRKAFWEKDTSFAVNYVIMQSNLDEIREAIDFWEDLRIDMLGLIFMVIRDDNEYLRNQSLHPILEKVHQTLDDAAEYLINSDKKICISSPPFTTTQLREKYPLNFPTGNVVKSMHSGKKNFPKLSKNGLQTGKFPGMPFEACKSAFTFARILPSGQVRLCDQANIGDINNQDFKDIWFGPEATAFRKRLLSSADTCLECNYYLLCLNQQNLNTKDPKTHLSKNLRNKNRES
ncbi:radical SAM/SPASM domain-containing protein [Nitrospina sp. 32_T5]|uniref:radical SAM protein n=1 Tax=unclassified Nitrospina TaxID=2638683 RepID=UPI003F9C2584